MSELRISLSAAHGARDEAQAAVDRARNLLRVGTDKLTEIRVRHALARQREAEEERAEVDRMHAALQAGEPPVSVQSRPLESERLAREMKPAECLIERLQAELEEKIAAHTESRKAVDRIIAAVMAEHAEVLAAELWESKRRTEALRARLDTFTRETPPDKPAIASRNIRKDLGGGAFIAAPIAILPDRFVMTASICKALYSEPSQDTAVASLFDHREASAWRAWAELLRSDPEAFPIPLLYQPRP
jgi:hypothetical protein